MSPEGKGTEYQEMEKNDGLKCVFCPLHYGLLCIPVCRTMAERRDDGDMQSGGDTVDALKFFSKG